jgi:hypothetical protein
MISKNALRKRAARARESDETAEKRLKTQRKRQRALRVAESRDECVERLEDQRERQEDLRAAESRDECVERLQDKRERQSLARRNEEEESHARRIAVESQRQRAWRTCTTCDYLHITTFLTFSTTMQHNHAIHTAVWCNAVRCCQCSAVTHHVYAVQCSAVRDYHTVLQFNTCTTCDFLYITCTVQCSAVIHHFCNVVQCSTVRDYHSVLQCQCNAVTHIPYNTTIQHLHNL